jgi:heavy metal translocating P-type ATPase
VIAALATEIATSLMRREVGLDIVALLSMTGALVLGEPLAGIVVGIMYAGGQFLESYALGRARREMKALLDRAPRSAMRYEADGLVEVPIDQLVPGDRVLVRRGEVVPVDGSVASDRALLDQSALTGEALPVDVASGGAAMSGSTNAGMAFDLIATRPAAESTYAGIVRLVEAASREKAPMVRIADRYAIWFLGVTLVIAFGAWAATGDPVRWLAVMVVATPCPLILAVPVAIVSGVSRAAKIGVLIKGGGALEALGNATTIVVDKTGTLTEGRAALTGVNARDGFAPDDVLRLAASLDQASNHVIASALVQAARQRQLALTPPENVHEIPGSGLEGRVGSREVAVGGPKFIARIAREVDPTPPVALKAGEIAVGVAVDGIHAGKIVFADTVRPDVERALATFRHNGVTRIVLASGDDRDITEAVGARLGLDAVESELTPQQKLEIVHRERSRGPVMMIGDGVNDAPALAAANIGVAMGARGAAASSEAADAVLLVEQIARIADAMGIARRSRAIALQSVYAGLGLSVAAMFVAAFGYLPPVQGALLQEAIDVVVILNALRALGGGRPNP